MFPYLPTFIHSFVDGAVFLFSGILLIFPKNKFSKEKKVLFIFWIAAGIIFWINAIQIVFFGIEMEEICFLFIKIVVCLMVTQVWIGVYFLFLKILKSQFLLNTILVILGIFSLFSIYFYLAHGQYEIVFGEPRVTLPNQPSVSYLTSLFLFILFLFVFWILYRDFKENGLSGKSLASIYRLLAVTIYGGVAFLRVLYFLPNPWYLEIFYFLIPILHYLSWREERAPFNPS